MTDIEGLLEGLPKRREEKMTAARPTVPSDAELDVLRELAIAVLADRLYILGSNQWANPELVARWNSEATPGTILQITRELIALRVALAEARNLLQSFIDKVDAGKAHSVDTYARFKEFLSTTQAKEGEKK